MSLQRYLACFLSICLLCSSFIGTVNAAKETKEKKERYLIGFTDEKEIKEIFKKKEIDTENAIFMEHTQTVSIELSDDDYEKLKEEEWLFLEEDAEVELANDWKINKRHDLVKKMESKKQSFPWGIERIGGAYSFAEEMTGDKIKIAVLDTGIAKHKDLDIAGGISFVEGSKKYTDEHGHGTHVAGIIAAQNNKFGVVGVAPSSEIYAVKVLDDEGVGTYSQVIQGIDWAIEKKMDIIHLSLGGQEDRKALHHAIRSAYDKGILIVAASGNNGRQKEDDSVNKEDDDSETDAVKNSDVTEDDPNTKAETASDSIDETETDTENGTDSVKEDESEEDVEKDSNEDNGEESDDVDSLTTLIYPAQYPEVLAVGAIDSSNERSGFSSTGSELDLVAPGEEILSTTLDGKYGVASGTSAAAAYVTGTAAVVWGEHRKYTNQKIMEELIETATPLGNEEEYGKGLVNAAKALGLVNGPIPVTDVLAMAEVEEPTESTYIREINNRIASLVKQMEYLESAAGKAGEEELGGKIANASNELRLQALELTKLTDEWKQEEENADEQYYEDLEKWYEQKDKEFEKLLSTYEEFVKDVEEQLPATAEEPEISAKSGKKGTLSAAAADTFEPNDSMSTAYPIAIGQIYESYIYSAGDKDYFTFTPTQSTTINIQLDVPSTKDYDIKVYDAAGNVVESGANGKGETEDITFFVNARSQYYVYVLGYSNAYSSTLSYEMKIVSLMNEMYPNSVIDVELSEEIEQVYRLTPSKSGIHHITTGPYGGSGPSNDTYLELYADEELTDLISENNDAHDTKFSQISVDMTAGVTYFLKLRHKTDYEGVYARLSFIMEDPDLIELTSDTPIDITMENGQFALFKFTPSFSGDYDIFTGPYEGNGEENDTYLELYADPNFIYLLDVDNDERDSKFSKLNYSLHARIPYYVKLRPNINEDQLKTRITATFDVPTYDNLAVATPIDISLPTGEEEVYQFIPGSTGTYKFYTSPYGGAGEENDTVLVLYDNAYLQTPIASNDDANGQAFSEIQATLKAGQAYYLKIRPYNSGISVNARLNVTTDVAVPAITISKVQVTESNTNDGSFPTPLVVTLSNGTFAPEILTGVTVNQLPAGLAVTVTRNSDTQITLTFTGKASNHANLNDVTNASVTIAPELITGATSSVTSGLFTFDFVDVGATGAYRYEYNEKNQLVRIYEKETLIMEFTYDTNGNLLTKSRKN